MYPEYKYIIGNEHRPVEQFDKDFSTACKSGIHFFLEKEFAERYDVNTGKFYIN